MIFFETLAISKAIHMGRFLDMEHVQNATLAGGVIMGAACDMILNQGVSVLAGSIAGIISTYGFTFLSPWLKSKGLTDTCGIMNLHLIPGLLGGLLSVIASAAETGKDWPAGSAAAAFPGRVDRSAEEQAAFQFYATLISLGFALVTGAISGAILSNVSCAEPMNDSFYEDAGAWNVPDDEDNAVTVFSSSQQPSSAVKRYNSSQARVSPTETAWDH